MEDELDMEVELERELQAEQEEAEEAEAAEAAEALQQALRLTMQVRMEAVQFYPSHSHAFVFRRKKTTLGATNSSAKFSPFPQTLPSARWSSPTANMTNLHLHQWTRRQLKLQVSVSFLRAYFMLL